MPVYTTSVSNSTSTKPIWSEGDYAFSVRDASEKKSRAENDMIELQLTVHNPAGDSILVYDHLVFVEGATWKIDTFRIATGEKLQPGVKSSLEANECIGRKGRLTLGVDTYQGRLKNKVEAYLEPEEPTSSASTLSQVPLKISAVRKKSSSAVAVAEAEPNEIPF
jgi:hypothetical protein